MEIKTMTTEEDKEYREALHEYYAILNYLRKKFDLRPYWKSDVWHGTTIEIIHKLNRQQGKVICNVTTDNSTDAMRIATRDLEHFRNQNMNRT